MSHERDLSERQIERLLDGQEVGPDLAEVAAWAAAVRDRADVPIAEETATAHLAAIVTEATTAGVGGFDSVASDYSRRYPMFKRMYNSLAARVSALALALVTATGGVAYALPDEVLPDDGPVHDLLVGIGALDVDDADDDADDELGADEADDADDDTDDSDDADDVDDDVDDSDDADDGDTEDSDDADDADDTDDSDDADDTDDSDDADDTDDADDADDVDDDVDDSDDADDDSDETDDTDDSDDTDDDDADDADDDDSDDDDAEED